MELLDIHTHQIPQDASKAIWSCNFGDTPVSVAVKFYSVGIHPWYLTEENLEEQWAWLLSTVRSDNRVVAVGEAGLDRAIDVSFDLQVEAFSRVAGLADSVKKPLIIHAVRTANEIIALKRKLNPGNPWIIHGFRGKKELALQYLREGIYLSFGEKFNEDALKAVPIDRLFFETDESKADIRLLYERASQLLNMPVDALVSRVQQTIGATFGLR